MEEKTQSVIEASATMKMVRPKPKTYSFKDAHFVMEDFFGRDPLTVKEVLDKLYMFLNQS